MTSVNPRPMQTPNLAGLLAKPPRPVKLVPADPVEEARPTEEKSEVDATSDVGDQTNQQHVDGDRSAITDPSDTATLAAPSRAKRPTGPKAPVRRNDAEIASSPAPDERQYLRSIAVYLPRSLYRTVGKYADERGTTRTAVILTAVNDTHHRLTRALVADSPPPSAGGDLFDIPQGKTDKEPTMQTSIRVTDRQFNAMATLAKKLETNRSKIIAAAVTLYFNDLPTAPAGR